LDWLLRRIVTKAALSGTKWADLRYLRKPTESFEQRVRLAAEDYPCDILFIHRDAEAQSPDYRRIEIQNAVQRLEQMQPVVCVVPVRMTEAWLLLDEVAIRKAAGNPKGRLPLNLPASASIERVTNPKEELYQALRTASEQTGRRLRNLRVDERRHRVAELMDYALLHDLPAFQSLEDEVKETLAANGWE
jgi:hypothetical protein